ncbi:MAG: bifunctional UDP-N-acetylglucosamine diphosphorylase/glucosamine-1-phosphate N-acetyltransferase GlmU [Deltaproteobacteria bacterium]|nr:bifunctional UDP-N-acetylglucosamine diphosphorylase/glucosamine-1-phosphate N-acetyltransferase GlmU [Deltaproteobacteria bacterium]
MAEDAPIAVILAAGLGTRMKSDTAKVLHRVAGRPLVAWPVELARSVGARRVVMVLGHQLEAVQRVLDARYGPGAVAVTRQERQLGTGDAVRQALSALEDEPKDATVLILSGDVPLLERQTLLSLTATRGHAPLALVGTRPANPTGYGRLVRDSAGRLMRIVEEKDATDEEKRIAEVNAGIYAVSLGFLRAHLGGLTTRNAQGEFYLTDLVGIAFREGSEVRTILAPEHEVAGINDRVELARMDALARLRIAEAWMQKGVTIVAPETVSIDADVTEIGKDSEIFPGVSLRGNTSLGMRVRVDAGCVITDSVVGDDAVLKPCSILTESRVGPRAQVGPFAHLRPGSVLSEDVHLGNFVETKKTSLGPGAKANHLSYLGDAVIGARVNVGAGTITCNYDGVHKHTTVIEDEAFIGSDTQLVAPVRVGAGAYVGAGTTVTRDVPQGALALTRVEQKHLEGYAKRKRAREGKKSEGKKE